MTALADPVASFTDVGISYRRRPVIHSVSLDVPAGAVLALLGRNGSGKTSLLRCLLGVQQPSRGMVRVFGLDPWCHRVAVLTRTGVVPESPDAPGDLSAERLVRLYASLHHRWDAEGVFARLERFGIPRSLEFSKLSRGQKSGVMLALACGHAPDLFVLDDPTLGLDVVARSAVFAEVIAELAERGTTVLLTTHDLQGIEGLATHVAILHGGRIVAGGELEALKAERQLSLEELFVAEAGGKDGVA